MCVYVHEWQREKDPKFVSFFVSSKSVSMQYNWMNSDFILWKMWSFLGIPVCADLLFLQVPIATIEK